MPPKKMDFKKITFVALLSLVFFTSLFPSSTTQGWLIFLDGTSSSGKTSVASKLKDKMFEQTKIKFMYESHDDFNNRKWAAQEANDDEDDDDGEEEDDDDSLFDYLHYIKNLVRHGKSVIGDIALMDEQDRIDYKSIIGTGKKFVCAMVFCPPIEIPQRVQARKKYEDRNLYQAIAQIPDMFIITHKQNPQVVGTISKKELNEILKPLKKELELDNKKKRKEKKKLDNVPKILRILRADLSPKKGNIAYLQPKMPHDVIAINSCATGPAVAAQKIADYTIGRMRQEQLVLIK